MTQAHSTGLWKEPAANGSTPTVAPAFYVNGGTGGWEPATEGTEAARVHDIGEGYTLYDITSPWVLISDGAGGLVTASSGTAAGILIDDGAGGLETSTDPNATSAGRLLTDGAGDVTAVPDAADDLRLAQVNSSYLTYP